MPELFDAAPYTVDAPLETTLSAGQRRTIRYADALARGVHPLSVTLRVHIPLHPEAAPHDDRDAPGRRCGTCRWRLPGRYAKCLYGWDGDRRHGPPRVTNGPGTDVRAWWSGCRDHEYGDVGRGVGRQLTDEAEATT